MSFLEIKNLSLEFNLQSKTYEALHNVSLDLNKGEFLALVGESGSGKTLTAMSILGLIPNTAKITSGEILYNNQHVLTYSNKEMQKIR